MGAFSAFFHTRTGKLAAVAAGLLLLLAALAFCRGFVIPLPEGTVIGGVEVSGLTPAQARSRLDQALEESLYTRTLTLRLPEEQQQLSAGEYGIRIRTGGALFAALHPGTSEPEEVSLREFLEADREALRKVLEDYAARYDTELTQPAWHLQGRQIPLSTKDFPEDPGALTLELTMGTPSQHLEVDTVLEEVLDAFAEAVILCREDRYQVTPEVTPEALPEVPDAAAIVGNYQKPPVNDTVDRENFTFVHGSYGIALDEMLLARKLRTADYGETISLPLTYSPPEILGEAAYFQEVLGAYETRHNTNANRNNNLRLQCEALDGLVLQPGETFSMNETLGERTIERGYLPAPAYSGNRLVNSPGGGVCQGTTTLYNCVLLADLDVVFRVCHGVKVGYVPLGLDAAVNWLTTDFQFRNNFSCPIRLKAWLEDGYMKMQILGTDEKDYYIKMETGSGEDDVAYYARSYKCKYDKQTHELLSREVEAYSTYYKNIE